MSENGLPWRILIPAVLAPNIFFATGRGAVIPTIPLLAVHMGASSGTAALIAALLIVGELSMSLTASWLAVRIGERASMILGATVTIVGAAAAMLAPTLAVLTAGVLLLGAAGSVYLVARQAWVAITIPAIQRGRAYSLVAGSQRAGLMVGPLCTTFVLAATEDPRWTFAVAMVTALGVVAVLVMWPTPAEPHHDSADDGDMPGVLQTLWRRREVLVRLGVAASLLGSMRAVRQVIVPLWGTQVGLVPTQITFLVTMCSAIDVALFYSGGQITDKFGRLWVAVPTMLGFAVANLGLAISSQLPGQVTAYVAMSVLMALANSISSGVNATMGADLADPRQPAIFLGSWRLVNETGSATVPVLMSAVTAVTSLAAAASVVGLLGLVGTVAMWRYINRYLPSAP